jgi:hypothetical protein
MPIQIIPRQAKKYEPCGKCGKAMKPDGQKVINRGMVDVYTCLDCNLSVAFFPSQEGKILGKLPVLLKTPAEILV